MIQKYNALILTILVKHFIFILIACCVRQVLVVTKYEITNDYNTCLQLPIEPITKYVGGKLGWGSPPLDLTWSQYYNAQFTYRTRKQN